VDYDYSTLELKFKYEPIADFDVDVGLDLIDFSLFEIDGDAPPLDEGDEVLIMDEEIRKRKTTEKAFLRKFEYETLKVGTPKTKKGKKTDDGIKSIADLMKHYRSKKYLEKKISEIEQTFEDAENKNFVHPKNKNLKIESCLPLFPDEELWGNQYYEFIFDTDPVANSVDPRNVIDQKRENAIIGSFTTNDESYLTYFTPQLGKNDNETDTYYDWVRKYHYKIPQAVDDYHPYVLIKGEDKYTYVPIRRKVEMQKMVREEQQVRPKSTYLRKYEEIPEHYIEERNAIRAELEEEE